MNASHHPTAAPLEKAGINSGAPSQRLLRLGIGLFITFCPLAVWGMTNLALDSDFIEKNSWRVHLDPGEERELSFTLDARDLRVLNEGLRWVLPDGTTTLLVGASSKDIRLRGGIETRGK